MLQRGRDALKESSNYLNTPKGRHSSRLFGVFLSPVKHLVVPKSILRYKEAILVVASLFVPLCMLLGVTTPVAAATSSTLNFQGRILSSTGSVVADGTYNIRFKIYDGGTAGGPAGAGEANAGTLLWTDTRYDQNGGTAGLDYRVTVKYGYFSVALGDTVNGGTAFPSTINWDQELWLTMDIGGTAQTATPTWDGEMLATGNKRFRLTAVPYAFSAGTALGVTSNPTTTASTNSGNVTIATGNASGATSNSGNLTIDTGTATGTAGTISLGASNTSAITLGRSGITTTNNGALTVTQLLTGNLGLTVSGAAISLNNNSNFAVNIGTGAANTQTVTIGGGNGTFSLQTTNIDISTAGAISGVTGYAQSSGAFAFSGAGNFSVDSAAFDVTAAGAVSGVTTLTTSGNITSTGGYFANLLNTNLTNMVRNGSIENGTTYWAVSNGGGSDGAVNTYTTEAYFGPTSLRYTRTTYGTWSYVSNSLNSYLPSPYFDTNKTYTLSFYVKSLTTTPTLTAHIMDGDATDNVTTCTGLVLSTSWQKYTCTFTPSVAGQTPIIYLTTTSTPAAVDFIMDGFMLTTGSQAFGYSGLQVDRTDAAYLNAGLTVAGNTSISGTATVTGALTANGGGTIRGLTVETATATQDRILVTAAAVGAARFNGSITNADLTAARTYTLPDASGTFAVSASGNIALSAAGAITLTGTVGVTNGGTGAGTFTTNGVLYGNGTSALGVTAAGTTGQCLVATTGNAPTWGSCAGTGSGVTLQAAYDNGNTITTSDARNISITFADTTTDANLVVTTATGSTGFTSYVRADGAGTADPAQLVLIDNLDVDRAQPIGLKIQSAAGAITTAIDASDAEIVTGLALGSNDVTVNGATIAATEFSLLDGRNAALVDTNDAVATAITGTGTLTAGALGAGFTTVAVGQGGTGATTLTSGGILFGNGTGAITASAVLTNGQLLIGDGTGAPTAATLTQGSDVTITNGAGSITIAVNENPTFTTSVTTPSLTNTAALTVNATSANLTLQTTTSGNVVINGAGTLDVQDNATFAGTLSVTGASTLRGLTVDTATATDDRIVLSVTTFAGARFDGTITNANLTAARTYTLPDASGTLAVSASGNIALSAAGNITLTGTVGVTNGGTGTTTQFTQGSVVFAGASGVYSQDNAALFYDATNDRLAVGTNTVGSNRLTVNNAATSDNIFVAQDNGVAVATIANEGAVIFQNSTNSTTAFQVQNASGASLLSIDTSTTSNLISNNSFEVNTTGWAAKNSGALTRITSEKYSGVASLQIVSPGTNNGGASFNYTFTASTQYTLSMYAKLSSGTMTTAVIGRQDVSGSDIDCTAKTLSTVYWTRLICTFTTGATITSSNIYIKDTSNTHTFLIDAVQLETGAYSTPFNPGGKISLTGVVSGATSFEDRVSIGNIGGTQDRNPIAGGTNVNSLLSLGQEITDNSIEGFRTFTNYTVLNPVATVGTSVLASDTQLTIKSGSTQNFSGNIFTNQILFTNNGTGNISGTIFGNNVSLVNNAANTIGSQISLQALTSTTAAAATSYGIGVKGGYTNSSTGTTSNAAGGEFSITNSSSGNITNGYGIQGFLQNTGAGSITTLAYGGELSVRNTGSGNIPSASAVRAYGTNSGTATMTTFNGLDVSFSNTNASATITDVRGLYVQTPTNTGTISNTYGIYIQSQETSGLSYGGYISGGSDYGLTIAGGNVGAFTIQGAGTTGYAAAISNGTSTGNIMLLQDNATNVLVVADGGYTTITANGGTGVALTVNNGTSTGNILNLQDNGANILTVADGGATTIAPGGASAVALTVNGTTGTAATALAVVQTGAATAMTVSQSAAANGLAITSSNASQTTQTALSVTQSGTTTGYTGDFVNFTGSSTTGSGNVVKIIGANTTAGAALNITTNSLTTGDAVNINSTSTGITTGSLLRVSTATTAAVATDGVVSLNATGNYSSTANAGLLQVAANATTAGTVAFVSGTAVTTGTVLQVTGGTGTTTGSTLNVTNGRSQFTPTMTIPSAAAAVWNGINVAATTATVTGTTAITTATGFNLFSIAAPTVTNASAVTITNAATSYIGGAPIQAGSVTITNAYSLWVDSGDVRFDGVTSLGAASSAGTLRIYDANGQYTQIVAGDSAGNLSLTLPTTVGNANECLRNGGTAGTLIFGSCAGVSTLTDNVADAYDLQEGSNNYININTTNGSENISLGNATTNPSYSLLGSGNLTVGGNILSANSATGTTTFSNTTAQTNTTSITVNSATGFAVNDIIFIDNAGQDFYTRITNITTNTFTVSPAVSVDNTNGTSTPAVTKYQNVRNLGATNTDYTTQTQRFFQGYFLGGVVTGAGSTSLSDQSLMSTGALYVKTNGENTRLTIDTNGNVGIGTTGPTVAARLTVVGAVSTSTTPASWVQNAIYDNGATSTQNISEYRVEGTRRGSLRVSYLGNTVLNGSGTGAVYLAYDEGTGGVLFGNGAAGTVGSISSVGNASFNGTLTVNGGAVYSYTTGVLPNGDFEQWDSTNTVPMGYTNFWAIGSPTVARSTTHYGNIGSYSAQVTFVAASNGYQRFQQLEEMEVTPGEYIDISFYAAYTGTAGGTAPSAGAVLVSNDQLNNATYFATGATATNIVTSCAITVLPAWQLCRGTVQVPAGDYRARIDVNISQGNAAGVITGYVDKIQATRRPVANVDGNVTAGGTLTVTGSATVSGGQLSFDNGTSNWVYFPGGFTGAPTFTTRSVGTRIVLADGLTGSAVDYALGITTSTLWQSVATFATGNKFAWYGGTTEIATLDGTGNLAIDGDATINGNNLTVNNTGNSSIVFSANAGSETEVQYNSGSGATGLAFRQGGGTQVLKLTGGGNVIVRGTAQYTERLCHNGANGAAQAAMTLGDCNAAGQADLAEMYDTNGNLEPGDIVYPVGQYKVDKADMPYKQGAIGIVSTNPIADGIIGNNVTSPTRQPIALAGRVPLKISLENGPIAIGDPLTPASIPGYAMKALVAGQIIGYALESYDGTQSRVSSLVQAEEQDRNIVHINNLSPYTSNTALWPANTAKIMVFVNVSYYSPAPNDILQGSGLMLTGNATIGGSLNISGATTLANLSVTGTATITALVVTGDTSLQKLTVNGKIITAGAIPTVATGVAAGTGLTTAAVVTGNDTAGTVTITTGTTGLIANDILGSVTFSDPFETVPSITISANTEDAASIRVFLIKTTIGWSIKTLDTPQPNKTYSFDYHVLGVAQN